jgi:hypothetical protein
MIIDKQYKNRKNSLKKYYKNNKMKNKNIILKYLFNNNKIFTLSVILIFFFSIGQSICDDPFMRLGIPVLNPSKLFSTNDDSFSKNNMDNTYWNKKMSTSAASPPSFIPSASKTKPNTSNKRNILDQAGVENMLEQAGLSKKIGIQAVCRFLLTRDPELKNVNIVFDKNQFSGLNQNETISFMDPEKTNQKIKSAANMFFRNNMNNYAYEFYGTQENLMFRFPGWKCYKTLMVNKMDTNDRMYIEVFYPLDDMLPPIILNDNTEGVLNEGVNQVRF